MRQTEERYISLLTDFGFKRIFGTVPNKELLIDFLNSLFDGEQVIKSVTFLNSEHVGDVFAERKAIFDVYCENEHGEKFIVEMQNAYQTYFKDRSLYYATFPIREQAPKGDSWNHFVKPNGQSDVCFDYAMARNGRMKSNFKLQHVYVVALLNYDMSDASFSNDTINHDVGLLDKQTYRVFNEKLTFKYVEISKFNKSIDELETNFDKWLFVLRNLSRLDNQPEYLKTAVFNRLFKAAEIAHFTKTELREYEDSLKAYRDIKNSLDTAKAEGHAEGMEEGVMKGRAEGRAEALIQVAKDMLKMKMPIDKIMEITKLTAEEIKRL